MNITSVTGRAYRQTDKTQGGKPFFRLRLIADADFELAHHRVPTEQVYFHADQLGDPCFPGNNSAFDWNSYSSILKADRPEFLEPVRVGLFLNAKGFVEVAGVEVTGALMFNPGYTLHTPQLLAFEANGGVLPDVVRKQMEVNQNTPNTSFFTRYPHGPWTTTTGLAADLVSRK